MNSYDLEKLHIGDLVDALKGNLLLGLSRERDVAHHLVKSDKVFSFSPLVPPEALVWIHIWDVPMLRKNVGRKSFAEAV